MVDLMDSSRLVGQILIMAEVISSVVDVSFLKRIVGNRVIKDLSGIQMKKLVS